MVVRYLPKALGNHQGTVSFVAVPEHAGGAGGNGRDGRGAVGGAVLAEAAVEAMGSCQGVRERAVHLPGGPDATPETFTKPRWALC